MHQLITVFLIATYFGPMPEGTVSFTPGFPVAVPKTGAVLINGYVRPSPGFVLTSAKVGYWKDGMVLHTRVVTIRPDGRIGPTYISGLTPGAEYYIGLEVVESGQGQEQMLANLSRVRVR